MKIVLLKTGSFHFNRKREGKGKQQKSVMIELGWQNQQQGKQEKGKWWARRIQIWGLTHITAAKLIEYQCIHLISPLLEETGAQKSYINCPQSPRHGRPGVELTPKPHRGAAGRKTCQYTIMHIDSIEVDINCVKYKYDPFNHLLNCSVFLFVFKTKPEPYCVHPRSFKMSLMVSALILVFLAPHTFGAFN